MKLNKKIIIPAFALLAGASLAGSVTGTIAWYQYSTRANASYIGTSAGTIGNLQIRINDGLDDWDTKVSTDDVLAYLSRENLGQKVEPVTPGALGKDDALKKKGWVVEEEIQHGEELPENADPAPDQSKPYLKVNVDTTDAEHPVYTGALYRYDAGAWTLDNSIPLESTDQNPAAHSDGYQFIDLRDSKLYTRRYVLKDFYLNPVFGYGPYSQWRKADASKHFVRIPLQLRFIGEDENDLKAHDVYLSKLLIQEDRHNDDEKEHGDLSDAIRVHFSAYKEGTEETAATNRLVSKNGGSTATHGKLKLGRGSGEFDKAYSAGDDWGFNGSEYTDIIYGEGSQVSYGAVIKEGLNESYYDDDHNYYEKDEIPEDADGWKELDVFATGNDDPSNAAGAVGNFYIKTIDEARQLWKKVAGEWEDLEADVQRGEFDPNTDAGASLDTTKFYLKTDDDGLYEYNNTIPAWQLRDDVLVEDNDNADFNLVAEGKLRVNSETDKLYSAIPDHWNAIASTLLAEDPEIAEEGDFVVGNYYIRADQNKLFRYDGGIYKEKVHPILVSENVDENNPVKLGDTDGKSLGKTVASPAPGDASPQKYLNVDVTIWVEGWQKFNRSGKLTSLWDKDLIGAMFDVGMQFAVQDLDA